MLAYYGYTISPNQLETGEGFLICRNVPIARTGEMEYLASELGLDGSGHITVRRSLDEVFSDAALASFEGKPVTDEHPPELLTPDNCVRYIKGHAQNVRRGTGEWEGHVVADLHIHDESLIHEIQSGKREISCGYECTYSSNGDGTYSQQNIRGNHVAVVTRGRAGKNVAILDSDTINNKQAVKPERKSMKKGLFLKLFGQAAKGAAPEELEQLAMDAAEALESEDNAPTPNNVTAQGDNTPGTSEAEMEVFAEKVAAMVLKKLGKQEQPTDADPLETAIQDLSGTKQNDATEEPEVVPAEESKKEISSSMDKATVLNILKSVRPAVAGIKDAVERKKVTDSLLACITSGEDDNSKLVQVAQKNAKKATDSSVAVDLDACQAAYDKMNPHKANKGGNQ